MLSVDLEHRGAGYPLVRSLRLRDLLVRLYPNRRPSPREYWPRLMDAAEALASHRARIPWQDPVTGRGGLRSVVTVSDIPRGPGALDDLVSLTVHLPPGPGAGPIVSPRLPVYGVKSGAQYRALIGLAYLWFNPGIARTPVGKGKRRTWVQSDDPRLYPHLDDDAIIPLCFPTSTRGQRRNLRSEARKALRALAAAGEVRLVDDHMMPPRASAARAPQLVAGLHEGVRSSVFVAQFEDEGHGRELGIAVPQELRTGGVACTSKPPAEACEQLDRLAQVLG